MNETVGIGSRVKHPEFGMGVVIQEKSGQYLITFIEHGTKAISHQFAGLEIIEAQEPSNDLVSFIEIENSLVKILKRFGDMQEIVPLGEKWTGGKLILQPADPELKAYEMPISTFFHKIVMVREKIRVMEQRINSSNLTDEEKINLQQYISKIYGSLTSFNILFKHPTDRFSSK